MSAEKRPAKGILKPSTSFDKEGQPCRTDKEMKWDEMNILATYHPADKEYGFKKIDEPPTPYNRLSESEGEGEEDNVVDPQTLASSLTASAKLKVVTNVESSEDDEDEDLTEEEKAKKRDFIRHRKQHYNEFQAVKLARQLLETEDDEGVEEASGSNMALDDVRDQTEMDTVEAPTNCPDEINNENL